MEYGFSLMYNLSVIKFSITSFSWELLTSVMSSIFLNCSTHDVKLCFDLKIICTSTHNVSFVQVRGSVPVYWSQPGYKYRPPPRIDRGL